MLTKLGLLIFSMILLSSFVSAAYDSSTYSCPMGGMMYGFSGTYGLGGAIFSWLFGLLVIVALILLIFWLIKQIQKK